METKQSMINTRYINTELPWKIIESYFEGQHLKRCIRHQLESYNDFVSNQIQKTIDMFNPVTIHSEHDYDKKSKKYSLELIITFNNHRFMKIMVQQRLCTHMRQDYEILHTHLP
jgi:DNA-directed RNA polymerase beta subunit